MLDDAQFGANFSANEVKLIGEAVRRSTQSRQNSGISRDAIVAAVVAEASRGTRNMFGLVKAGSRIARSL